MISWGKAREFGRFANCAVRKPDTRAFARLVLIRSSVVRLAQLSATIAASAASCFLLHVEQLRGDVKKLRLPGDKCFSARIDELGRDHRIAVRK